MTEEGSNGRALITGAGAVTPLGTGVENFWDAALHGKSGIGEITLFDASPFPSQIAGECSDFDPTDFMPKKAARRMDRFAQLGVAAGLEAAENAGIVDLIRESPERVAIVIGSGIGGLSTWEREYRILNDRGPGRVSRRSRSRPRSSRCTVGWIAYRPTCSTPAPTSPTSAHRAPAASTQ